MDIRERLKLAYENVKFAADNTQSRDSGYQKANMNILQQEKGMQEQKNPESSPTTAKDYIPNSKLAKYGNDEHKEARESPYSEPGTSTKYDFCAEKEKEPWMLQEADTLFKLYTDSDQRLVDNKELKRFDYIKSFESPFLRCNSWHEHLLKLQITSDSVKRLWNAESLGSRKNLQYLADNPREKHVNVSQYMDGNPKENCSKWMKYEDNKHNTTHMNALHTYIKPDVERREKAEYQQNNPLYSAVLEGLASNKFSTVVGKRETILERNVSSTSENILEKLGTINNIGRRTVYYEKTEKDQLLFANSNTNSPLLEKIITVLSRNVLPHNENIMEKFGTIDTIGKRTLYSGEMEKDLPLVTETNTPSSLVEKRVTISKRNIPSTNENTMEKLGTVMSTGTVDYEKTKSMPRPLVEKRITFFKKYIPFTNENLMGKFVTISDIVKRILDSKKTEKGQVIVIGRSITNPLVEKRIIRFKRNISSTSESVMENLKTSNIGKRTLDSKLLVDDTYTTNPMEGKRINKLGRNAMEKLEAIINTEKNEDHLLVADINTTSPMEENRLSILKTNVSSTNKTNDIHTLKKLRIVKSHDNGRVEEGTEKKDQLPVPDTNIASTSEEKQTAILKKDDLSPNENVVEKFETIDYMGKISAVPRKTEKEQLLIANTNTINPLVQKEITIFNGNVSSHSDNMMENLETIDNIETKPRENEKTENDQVLLVAYTNTTTPLEEKKITILKRNILSTNITNEIDTLEKLGIINNPRKRTVENEQIEKDQLLVADMNTTNLFVEEQISILKEDEFSPSEIVMEKLETIDYIEKTYADLNETEKEQLLVTDRNRNDQLIEKRTNTVNKNVSSPSKNGIENLEVNNIETISVENEKNENDTNITSPLEENKITILKRNVSFLNNTNEILTLEKLGIINTNGKIQVDPEKNEKDQLLFADISTSNASEKDQLLVEDTNTTKPLVEKRINVSIGSENSNKLGTLNNNERSIDFEEADQVFVADSSTSMNIIEKLGAIRDIGQRNIDYEETENNPFLITDSNTTNDNFMEKLGIIGESGKIRVDPEETKKDEWFVIEYPEDTPDLNSEQAPTTAHNEIMDFSSSSESEIMKQVKAASDNKYSNDTPTDEQYQSFYMFAQNSFEQTFLPYYKPIVYQSEPQQNIDTSSHVGFPPNNRPVKRQKKRPFSLKSNLNLTELIHKIYNEMNIPNTSMDNNSQNDINKDMEELATQMANLVLDDPAEENMVPITGRHSSQLEMQASEQCTSCNENIQDLKQQAAEKYENNSKTS